jgi:hypothetical protein
MRAGAQATLEKTSMKELLLSNISGYVRLTRVRSSALASRTSEDCNSILNNGYAFPIPLLPDVIHPAQKLTFNATQGC